MADQVTDAGGAARPMANTLQATLVRAYKAFGLIALLLILVGLFSFFFVNVFYLFDNSWIRPVILTPADSRVIANRSMVLTESNKRDEMQATKSSLEIELAALDAKTAEHKRFAEDVAQARVSKGSLDGVLARRQLQLSELEIGQIEAKKKVLSERIQSLSRAIAAMDAVVSDMKMSPYHKATESSVTVAFVPYENLESIAPGDPVYGCQWQLVRCSKVGRIGEALEGEVSDTHPNSGNSTRGIMVQLDLDSDWAAKESALFVGGKPFWIL